MNNDNVLKKLERSLDPRLQAAKARAAAIANKPPATLETNILRPDVNNITPALGNNKLTPAQEKTQLLELEQDAQEQINMLNPAEVLNPDYSDLKLNRIGEQALKLLGQGVKPHVVATVLSVSESYISQLLADPNFAKRVTEKKVTTLTAATEHDENLDKLEAVLIKKMAMAIEYTNKPMEVARVFSIVNNAKRRGAANENAGVGEVANKVTLTLPVHALTKLNINVSVNESNQVLTVGEQQLGAIEPKFLMESYRYSKVIDSTSTVINKEAAATSAKVISKVSAAQSELEKLEQSNINDINLDDL